MGGTLDWNIMKFLKNCWCWWSFEDFYGGRTLEAMLRQSGLPRGPWRICSFRVPKGPKVRGSTCAPSRMIPQPSFHDCLPITITIFVSCCWRSFFLCLAPGANPDLNNFPWILAMSQDYLNSSTVNKMTNHKSRFDRQIFVGAKIIQIMYIPRLDK